MKRFLFLLLSITTLLGFTSDIQAQIVNVVNTVKTSLTNADTTYIKFETPDDAKSIQVVVKKVSGTAAGRAVLKASNDGVNFIAVGVDTLTFANQATNAKFWTIQPLNYAVYWVELISSGTTNLTAKGYMVRRRL